MAPLTREYISDKNRLFKMVFIKVDLKSLLRIISTFSCWAIRIRCRKPHFEMLRFLWNFEICPNRYRNSIFYLCFIVRHSRKVNTHAQSGYWGASFSYLPVLITHCIKKGSHFYFVSQLIIINFFDHTLTYLFCGAILLKLILFKGWLFFSPGGFLILIWSTPPS